MIKREARGYLIAVTEINEESLTNLTECPYKLEAKAVDNVQILQMKPYR